MLKIITNLFTNETIKVLIEDPDLMLNNENVIQSVNKVISTLTDLLYFVDYGSELEDDVVSTIKTLSNTVIA